MNQYFFLQIEATEVVHAAVSHSEIQQLLTKYNHIFAQPTTLPPFREQDHHIPLEPNSKPIFVRLWELY